MKKVKLFQLMDLVEGVKKIDDLISIHRKAGSANFMIDQYEAKKTQLMGLLISELASPVIQSPQSYLLIKMLLEKYYPIKQADQGLNDMDIEKLAKAV